MEKRSALDEAMEMIKTNFDLTSQLIHENAELKFRLAKAEEGMDSFQNEVQRLELKLAMYEMNANNKSTREPVNVSSTREPIVSLLGNTLKAISISPDKDKIIFFRVDNVRVTMSHTQQCCESVYLDDIVGEIEDLIGSPLTVAEVYTHWSKEDEHMQYTFYRLATVKGYVLLRWIGTSNGYYSTEVDVIASGIID